MEKDQSASFFLIIPDQLRHYMLLVALFYESCILFIYAKEKLDRNVGIYRP